MRRTLIPLIASLLSPAVLAADPMWFEIEMIVFKRDKGDSAERWPLARPTLETAGTIDLLTSVLQPSARHLKAMLPSCTEVPVDPYTFEQTQIIDLPPLADTLEQQQQLVVDFSEKFQRLSDFEETASTGYATTAPAVLQEEEPGEHDAALFAEQPPEPLALPRFGACQFPEETDWLFGDEQVPADPRKSRRTVTAALDEWSNEPYLLDKASLQLGEMAKKLRWFKGTRPLLHLGWRQPVYARHQARPFYFYGGEEFSERYQADGAQHSPADNSDAADAAVTPNSLDELAIRLYGDNTDEIPGATDSEAMTDTMAANNPGDLVDDSAAETPPALWEIEGLFKVYLNRFLFIETQFNRQQEGTRMIIDPKAPVSLTNATADQAVATALPEGDTALASLPKIEVPWLQTYPFEQHRRVRSKEIHYFDHPKMGIVVQIRRFKRPVNNTDS